MITSDQFFTALESPYLYEQFLVLLISEDGKIRHATDFADVINSNNCSIKVEGMERFNREIAQYCTKIKAIKADTACVSCHAFYSEEGRPSFNEHTDKTDVLLFCVEGKKTLMVNGEKQELWGRRRTILIPEGTPHKATNEHTSLTLSFGFEKYIEDVL
jgi:ribosomal protein L16 Arg81 hydroxylase